MPRTLYTPRHKALREFITAKRKEAKLTQAQLAKKVGLYQSFVADFERGERRLDVVQFLDFAEALDFEPGAIIRKIGAVKR
jgi:transcriptional regulator with XRE-family HTH domain